MKAWMFQRIANFSVHKMAALTRTEFSVSWNFSSFSEFWNQTAHCEKWSNFEIQSKSSQSWYNFSYGWSWIFFLEICLLIRERNGRKTNMLIFFEKWNVVLKSKFRKRLEFQILISSGIQKMESNSSPKTGFSSSNKNEPIMAVI